MTKIKNIESKFKDNKLFLTALTHKSWVNENPDERESNERLEFLGDAVLEFVVTNHLYKTFPDKNEGYLTLLRSNVVNTVNLAKFAKSIDLAPSIFISNGEKEEASSKSILADTVEAIIGAMYLDSGLTEVGEFIHKNLLTDEMLATHQLYLKDPKNMLQEKTQAAGEGTPVYRVIESSGPAHNRQFKVQVLVLEKVLGEGLGKSKSEAGTAAAKHALKTYGKNGKIAVQ